MNVSVLRLGHRIVRDKRLTTHVALTSRAFGAEKIYIEGEEDQKLIKGVESVAEDWGGAFEVVQVDSWRPIINDFEGYKIHLTMYGLPFQDILPELNAVKPVLLIVGGGKVPSDLYGLVDFNVSVGGQPHSEVAALAITLDRLTGGGWVEKQFPGGKKIIPQKQGKKIV